MNRNSKSKARRGRRQGNKTANNAPTVVRGPSVLTDMKLHLPTFPPQFRRMLRYSEVSLNLSSGAAGIGATYFFSANGAYDPNITGSGHQPLNFDQMMLNYEHYTVVTAKIHIEASNVADYGEHVCVGLYLSPDTTSITDVSRLMENGLLVYKHLTPIGGNVATGAVYADNQVQKLDLGCNVMTYFGRHRSPRELLQDTQLAGDASANPAEQVYFGVLIFDPTTTNVVGANFIVNIEFDIIFWEPRKVTQSLARPLEAKKTSVKKAFRTLTTNS
jgi:hypothetical protein